MASLLAAAETQTLTSPPPPPSNPSENLDDALCSAHHHYSDSSETLSFRTLTGESQIYTELGILMQLLGGNPTQAQLKSIVVKEKQTVSFDFKRFLELMSKHMKPKPFDRQLKDTFKVLNKDAIGFFSVSELRHILTSISEILEPFEFDEWIREFDVGTDGNIKYDDFIARMVAK